MSQVKKTNTFDVTNFWRHPDVNQIEKASVRDHYLPQHYVHAPHVTKEITDAVYRYVEKDDTILEIGCSVGRNLAALKALGYQKLIGIEINQDAVELGQQSFDLDGVDILVGSIEELADECGAYDCIFTQSVLMHLPPSSEWVFGWIAERTRRVLITRESERRSGKFQWGRDYGKVFTELGLTEIELREINNKLRLRVFAK